VGLAIFKRPVVAGLFSFLVLSRLMPNRRFAEPYSLACTSEVGLGYRTIKTGENPAFALFFAVKPKNRFVD